MVKYLVEGIPLIILGAVLAVASKPVFVFVAKQLGWIKAKVEGK